MDNLVTLRTSDDPPVELKAARSVLVAGSKVFSDMLSLPQSTTTSKDGAIDVAETESELSTFVRLLNLSHDEGDPLEELKVDDWPVVARLADKYDSAVVRGLALGMYWKWRSADSEHVAAYRTAAALPNKGLAKISLFRLLQDGKHEQIDAALSERKGEFDAWLTQLKLHAFEHSMIDIGSIRSPRCSFCRANSLVSDADWNAALRSSMQSWKSVNAGGPFRARAYRDSAPDFPL